MGVSGWVEGEMKIKANLIQSLVEVYAKLGNRNWKSGAEDYYSKVVHPILPRISRVEECS